MDENKETIERIIIIKTFAKDRKTIKLPKVSKEKRDIYKMADNIHQNWFINSHFSDKFRATWDGPVGWMRFFKKIFNRYNLKDNCDESKYYST